jgi:hypothetical protein
MKLSLASVLLNVAISCPFRNLKSFSKNPQKLVTVDFEELPEPENIPEGGYKGSVIKTPSLLRNDEAFLGILGPCSNYGLY